MKIITVLFCCLSVATTQFGGGPGSPSTCVMPTGETGRCVPSPDCALYQPYIRAGKDNPESTKFLRERICSVDPPNVSLCCPLDSPSSFSIPSEDVCGIPSGLSSNQAGAWPWLAAIGKLDLTSGFLPICAGALITNRHVLSTAHCFYYHRETFVVRLGEYHVQNDDAGERPEDYHILLFSFGSYAEKTHQNDIILLPLDREVFFTDRIRPVCLPFPFKDEEFVGQKLTIVGWGTPDQNTKRHSQVPVAGMVPVVDRNSCNIAYDTLRKIPINEKQICAGNGETDACSGDGGAPLTYYSPERNRYYLVGAVSFGPVGCANPDIPGVYTRISSYLDLIKRQLNLP